jgi:C4-dicarboxylate-specific signal transduction histidine kinase
VARLTALSVVIFPHRTGAIRDRSEIRQVAQHLDHLLDLVQERDQQLRDWNKELNERVEARALELQDATLQLETTTKQLVMSEKLAAIGEITAGVAHEINNPIAVMQGNLEVIRDLMGPSADKASTEFRLIDEQMHRITELVTKLLQFAKPQEYAGYTDQYTTAGIVSDTLPLVQHLLKRTTISVDREDRALQLISINRTELQQVLVNLIVNAIHAMPQGGRLTLRTYDSDMDGRHGVAIEVADTGGGMLPDVMQRIFDPFYNENPRWHRTWPFDQSDAGDTSRREDIGSERTRYRNDIYGLAAGGALSRARSLGHFVRSTPDILSVADDGLSSSN